MSSFPRRTRTSIAFALLLIALLAVGLMPTAAQSGPATTPEPMAPAPGATPAPVPATIEFVGLVQAVGPASLTINGQVVDTSFAEINSLITVGAPVKIEGSINALGQIVAREVRAVDLAQSGLRPGEIEVVGPLTGMTGPRLTVAGLPMDATTAEFGPGVGLGQLVKVHVMLNAANQWVIREIELASADDVANFSTRPMGEFEITGTLDAVDAGTISINGQLINISGAEVKDALVPGALVKVHLSQVNGQWVAREVELAGNDDRSSNDSARPAGEFEIYGTVSEIGSGYIVVNGQRISTSGAEVKDPLAVGSVVKIHLSNVNGQWVAREVELSDRNGDDNSNDDNSGSGSDDSGSGSNDDNSGSGSDDSGSHDSNDDHSGSGSSSGSGNSGSGNSGSDDSGNDDNNDDHSGSGSDDSGDDSNDGNSGSGSGDD